MKPKLDIKYIDIHGHIADSDYDADREAVVARAAEAGVGMIAIGTDLASSKRAVELAEKYENVWATVGVHPTESMAELAAGHGPHVMDFDYDAFKKLAIHPKVVAIGECGLEYFHPKGTPVLSAENIEVQRELFLKHIDLANEVGKPLMLHMRNGEVGGAGDVQMINAYREGVAILKERAKVPANFHFFAGTADDAKAILDIGGMVSFTGVLTFTRDYDEVVRSVSLERMMSETDCPFVAPKPHRGKRNEPAYVTEVVKAIAHIRGEGEVAVTNQLLENARKFFGL